MCSAAVIEKFDFSQKLNFYTRRVNGHATLTVPPITQSSIAIHKMNSTTYASWLEANQQYLTIALRSVRTALLAHADRSAAPESGADVVANAAAKSAPPALETLCKLFGLSAFERHLLLLCAGMELDADFPMLCSKAQGDGQRPFPTFSLALAALPEAHWSAINPSAPLRRWRLIEVNAGSGLVTSPLRIDERVLHYLTGIQHLDEQLVGFVQPVTSPHRTAHAPASRELVERITALWTQTPTETMLPAVQLCGSERVGKAAIAAAAATTLNLNLYSMSAHVLPTAPHDLDTLMRLWEREAVLSNSALLLDCDDGDGTDTGRENLIHRFIENLNSILLVATPARRPPSRRPLIPFEVTKPTRQEQQRLWHEALATVAPNLNGQINGQVNQLVAQFDLAPAAIQAACNRALGELPAQTAATALPTVLGELLWDACRSEARPRLDDLAQRIELVATWDDLVLPERQRQTLQDIAIHVRQREKVYQTWGFATKSARGLGISALFAGASGTGKTMAAEVLANTLRLDLYRIDLSQVVSKYIGETEKNLRRVFDAAEAGGAILLFDEADALFGKRSEVKDSHDRYANIEVGYLLQRMEAYQGLAILTTNMKSALDDAFLRRIRFVVQFPFPDATQRAEIWRRIFPSQTPTDAVVAEKLARLNVAGGNIRNIALHAAFLAAEADEPVRMHHLMQAARVEYAKLEKPLTESEIRGWV